MSDRTDSQKKRGRPPCEVRRVRVGTLFLLPAELAMVTAQSLPGEKPIETVRRLLVKPSR